MARDALSYQVSDYLVKLELTPEVLKNAIGRVLTQISQSRKKQLSAVNIHPLDVYKRQTMYTCQGIAMVAMYARNNPFL